MSLANCTVSGKRKRNSFVQRAIWKTQYKKGQKPFEEAGGWMSHHQKLDSSNHFQDLKFDRARAVVVTYKISGLVLRNFSFVFVDCRRKKHLLHATYATNVYVTSLNTRGLSVCEGGWLLTCYNHEQWWLLSTWIVG